MRTLATTELPTDGLGRSPQHYRRTHHASNWLSARLLGSIQGGKWVKSTQLMCIPASNYICLTILPLRTLSNGSDRFPLMRTLLRYLFIQ